MKKQITKIGFVLVLSMSIASFVFLNAENASFPAIEMKSDYPAFNVSSSSLPDVEAVKNAIIFVKEIFLFDL